MTCARIQLAAAVGVLSGLVIAGIGVNTARDALASRSWPTTRGVVEQSRVETIRSRRADRSKTYRPRVRYAYEVDGRSYSAERISFGDSAIGLRGPAARIADRYPGGSRVTVHYSPEQPAEAVLVTGLTLGSAGVPLVGLGVCLGSLLVATAAPRLARRAERDAQVVDRLPERLWDGGDNVVEIHVSTSHPAVLQADFSHEVWSEDEEEWEVRDQTEVRQLLSAGEHRFEMRVPDDVSAELEVDLDDPPVGAWIRWSIRVNGRERWNDQAELDEPLEPGYAFGVEAELDDLTV